MEAQPREKLIQNLGMINNGLVQDVTRETSCNTQSCLG